MGLHVFGEGGQGAGGEGRERKKIYRKEKEIRSICSELRVQLHDKSSK